MEAVGACRLFRHMEPNAVAALAPEIEVRNFHAGELVLERQEQSGSLYLALDGVLLAHQYARSGREVGFRRIVAGQYFGELGVIDNRPRSVNITALTSTRLGVLSRRAASGLIETSPALRKALMEDLASSVRELSERVFELSVLSIPCRLDMALLRMGLEKGVTDNQARLQSLPTHAELAALVGGQREAVTREFGRLEALGLIAREARTMVLLDMDRLSLEIERGGGDTPLIPR